MSSLLLDLDGGIVAKIDFILVTNESIPNIINEV
jgi:hypothetical protein